MPTTTEKLVNPELWNLAPIIDWDKFYAQNPDSKIPMVYDPPQRYGKGDYFSSMPMIGEKFETNMEYYFVDKARLLKPEEIAACGKPNAAKASEDLFDKILGPSPDSSKVPKPFRNNLLWMGDNHMGEEFCSFNKWAWRSQTEGNGRAIALGSLEYEWTNDASKLGAGYAANHGMISIQESPCKKYYKLAAGVGMIPGKPVAQWLTMYIIQEGDTLVDRDGNPVPDVSPGDIYRISYGDASDPYECSPDKAGFSYLCRKVATYNEETGKVERNPSQYERVMTKVNAPLPEGLENVSHLTHEERYDLSRKTLCDLQIYKPAPTPPTGAEIENL